MLTFQTRRFIVVNRETFCWKKESLKDKAHPTWIAGEQIVYTPGCTTFVDPGVQGLYMGVYSSCTPGCRKKL